MVLLVHLVWLFNYSPIDLIQLITTVVLLTEIHNVGHHLTKSSQKSVGCFEGLHSG